MEKGFYIDLQYKENCEMWDNVVSVLTNEPSISDIVYNEIFTDNDDMKDSTSDHNTTKVSNFSIKNKSIQCISESSESIKSLQRKFLTHATEEVKIPNHNWNMRELCSDRTLLVPDSVFIQFCVQSASLYTDHLEAIVLIGLLPTVSQLTDQLAHPCQQALIQFVEQQPNMIVEKCLCPALQYGSSKHTTQLTAKLIQQLPVLMLHHIPDLMKSLSKRGQYEEVDLVVLETACSVLPLPEDNIGGKSAAGAIVDTLRNICDKLPSNSNKTGRMLLAALHRLNPYLAETLTLKESFAQIVEKHSSPLQRPIQAQLNRIK